jgi:hypothetical protein
MSDATLATHLYPQKRRLAASMHPKKTFAVTSAVMLWTSMTSRNPQLTATRKMS